MLRAFVALGPLGNVCVAQILPESFRLYYFLLPGFVLFATKGNCEIWKKGVILSPLFLYCGISSCFTEYLGTASEPFSVLRSFLFFCQCFFVIGASGFFHSITQTEEAYKHNVHAIIKLFLISYSTSLLVGWLLFLGFYSQVIPLSVLKGFSVLTQFEGTLLRFSPGSYPNEYGILSSFALTVLTIIFCEKEKLGLKISARIFCVFYLLSFLALLCTTTRAAYIAYVICCFYVFYGQARQVRKVYKFLIAQAILLCVVVKAFMLQGLYLSLLQESRGSSLEIRYTQWLAAFEKVLDQSGACFWGLGFASITNIHNVYLQIILELGALGLLFIMSIFVSGWLSRKKSLWRFGRYSLDGSVHRGTCYSCFNFKLPISTYAKASRLDSATQPVSSITQSRGFGVVKTGNFNFKRPYNTDVFFMALRKIRVIGWIHVLFFAASNHNLNHYLTWFVIFLSLISPCKRPLRNGYSRLNRPLA